jgi:hypothetical protein
MLFESGGLNSIPPNVSNSFLHLSQTGLIAMNKCNRNWNKKVVQRQKLLKKSFVFLRSSFSFLFL